LPFRRRESLSTLFVLKDFLDFNLPDLTAQDLREHIDPADNILWNRTVPERDAECFQVFSQSERQGVRVLEYGRGMYGIPLYCK
jgi:hypothetical protein